MTAICKDDIEKNAVRNAIKSIKIINTVKYYEDEGRPLGRSEGNALNDRIRE